MGPLVALIVLFFLAFISSAEIKRPEFAGSFYPADRGVLEAQIEALLKDAMGEKLAGTPIGIISPHAGYEFCGLAMAHAYRQMQEAQSRTVLILGASHRYPFQGIAVYGDGAFQTPLGMVAVERNMARRMTERLIFARDMKTPFEKEHSIEVQLPFLQKTVPMAKIVPVLFGSVSWRQIDETARFLSRVLKEEEVAIVASSDMSHYHPEEEARRIDLMTLKMVEEMDVDGLRDALGNGSAELCGAAPVLTLLLSSRILGAGAKVLFYETSGARGGRNSVVGYGAVVFYKERPLTEGEARKLLSIARNSIASLFGKESEIEVHEEGLLRRRGVFVTLRKGGKLRGCMGILSPAIPLYEAVKRAAIAASREDPRFAPVSREELKEIRIEISIIGPLRRVRDLKEIQLGKDGLLVVKGARSGLLLPQVAREYGLSREAFLAGTLAKAGLDFSALLEKETALYAFRAQVFSE